MPYRGELVGIEDQRIRLDRQIASAIRHDIEGQVTITATLRIGDLICRTRQQPVPLQALAPGGRSDAGRRTRDLAEFILLYAISTTVRISLVRLPGIAQVGWC